MFIPKTRITYDPTKLKFVDIGERERCKINQSDFISTNAYDVKNSRPQISTKIIMASPVQFTDVYYY
jgi:hypothetical protein